MTLVKTPKPKNDVFHETEIDPKQVKAQIAEWEQKHRNAQQQQAHYGAAIKRLSKLIADADAPAVLVASLVGQVPNPSELALALVDGAATDTLDSVITSEKVIAEVCRQAVKPSLHEALNTARYQHRIATGAAQHALEEIRVLNAMLAN